MSNHVVLRFVNNGNGYTVNVELRGTTFQDTGYLPSVDQLFNCYLEWQKLYKALSEMRRGITVDPGGITNVSEIDFEEMCENLKQEINRWVGDNTSQQKPFSAVLLDLTAKLSTDDEILVEIQTDELKLWRLPWQLWAFFDTYEKAEYVLSLPRANPIDSPKNLSDSVQVLVILGDSTGIDLKEDQRLWEDLRNHGVTPEFLSQPNRKDITDRLWQDEGWSILFFGGHSNSETDATTGKLFINEQTENNTLRVNNIRQALQNAVKQGLQLAIINSCDGIGVAKQLLDLNFPRVIVMKEDVPNLVAQEFLKHFLKYFCTGLSLPIALRKAKARLEDLEDDFPCASWLPVLCKNSPIPSLTWEMLRIPIIIPDPPIPIPIPPPSIWTQIMLIIKRFWFLIVAIMAALIIVSWWPKQVELFPLCQNIKQDKLFSCGEKYLTKSQKSEGTNLFNQGQYDKAINSFKTEYNQSKEEVQNQPESLIFKNNAQIMFDLQKRKITKEQIGLVVVNIPYDNGQRPTDSLTKAILQGAAQRIDEFNNQNGGKIKLFVVIANDGNTTQKVQDIAKKLIEYQKDIIAVIGSYASKITTHLQEKFAQSGTKILVISGHTTRTPEGGKTEPPLENLKYFFRVTTTAFDTSQKLAKELDKRGINKVVLLADDSESFSLSFYKNFKEIWTKKEGKKIEDINYTSTEAQIKNFKDNPIKEKLTKFNNEKTTTAIVFCPAAFTKENSDDISGTFETARRIIKINNGDLLIAGCNTVTSLYNREELGELLENTRKNLIAVVPWYPNNNQLTQYNDLDGWNKESDIDLMRYALQYDAIKLLTDAITQLMLNNDQIPTSENIRNSLDSNTFSTNGITGEIKIMKHERLPKQDTIVTPTQCNKDKQNPSKQQCKWRKIDDK